MKVLVADDDPLHRHLLRNTLADWGYHVSVAEDGVRAWEILEGPDPPELVLLDWNMPGLDGEQVCKLVRTRAGEQYTYILLVTGRDGRGDLVRGLDAGADDYLRKPVDRDELKARLNTGRRILGLQADLIAAREQMRLKASRDSLTGAYNHAAIHEIFSRELVRASRDGKPLGVALADLDNFKRINDTHGHLAGDAVLRYLTDRIGKLIRPEDVLGRYGGEEFLLVLPGCDRDATLKVCERVRAGVADGRVGDPCWDIRATVSIGFAVFAPGSAVDPTALVRAADGALYRAKAGGRNRVEAGAIS